AAWLADSRGTEVPEDVRVRAVRLLNQSRYQAGRLRGELVSVVDALRGAAVRTLALKGPALGAYVYNDPLLRPSRDLDLLIAPQDRDRAVATLETIGYVARPRADGLAREIHLVNERRNFVVDLHWNVVGGEIAFEFDFDALWAERQLVEVDGGRADLPSAPWLAVLASLYLVKEFPYVELVYLADLERLAAGLSAADLAKIAEVAAATGTRRIVAVAFALLRRHGVPVDAPVPADAAVERLANRVERALADPRNARRRRYWHRVLNLLTHASFRERIGDRVRVIAALPSFLVRTDMDDVARAEREDRARWAARLRRLPEVAAALISPARNAERRVAAALADPRARVRPTPAVELFLLDGAGLLLDPGSGDLLALSPTAAFLWCALEEEMAVGELVDAYARTFARTGPAAAREIGAALLDWAVRGLVEGSRAPAAQRSTPIARPAPGPSPSTPSAVTRQYEVLGTRFRVGFEALADAAAADEVLGHFAACGAERTADAVCARETSGAALWIDGVRRDAAPTAEGLVPMVKHALVAEAVNRHGFALYVHGAMLRSGDSALLLPAAPGSGKTCLSLALAAAGFDWHTDEMVLLAGEDLRAQGVPACPCVKEPAWPLVEPFVPELRARRVHRRADGKTVRYPPPPCDPRDPALARSWPVRWIVFPRYPPAAGRVCCGSTGSKPCGVSWRRRRRCGSTSTRRSSAGSSIGSPASTATRSSSTASSQQPRLCTPW
ncbi:MAG TPA: PqqD family peptide modification chaperone, partial [Geminicoccaceae bacterium]|nr:PqqD family peptide modification chaperone [Geminicoccaceae bacterium]